MSKRGTRRLRDGREVDIGRNEGLRKVCRCDRRHWARCPHAWYFNFQWQREPYRFCLDRYVGRRLTNAEAEVEAERLRTAIRAGEFPQQPNVLAASPQPSAPTTFRQFADVWSARRGYQFVRPRDNDYRLKLICDFVLPGTEPSMTFGGKPVAEVTTGDIEAYRHHRRTQKRSPVTINHDLKLLRKVFAWGIRERLLTSTPFKVGSENVIRLDPESPREERLSPRRRSESCSPQATRIFEAC